ncbi:hypothetical protein C0J52_25370 [Blattella germanica]|nr:hypothetical protein C0J52_25370 [Blattella germanica]
MVYCLSKNWTERERELQKHRDTDPETQKERVTHRAKKIQTLEQTQCERERHSTTEGEKLKRERHRNSERKRIE